MSVKVFIPGKLYSISENYILMLGEPPADFPPHHTPYDYDVLEPGARLLFLEARIYIHEGNKNILFMFLDEQGRVVWDSILAAYEKDIYAAFERVL